MPEHTLEDSLVSEDRSGIDFRKESRTHVLPNGLEIKARSKANLQILWNEMYEDDIYSQFEIDLPEGACVFDVGANIGFFVMYLNSRLKDGRVFAFEPIPETFGLLRQNSEAHNKLDLTLFNCGLSKNKGHATFTHFRRINVASTMYPDNSKEFRQDSRKFVLQELRSKNRALRFLVDVTPQWLWYPLTETTRRFYQSGRRVECQISTVSDVIGEHEVSKIDLLKVDTEGSEDDVLSGIRDEHWLIIDQVIVEVHKGVEGLERITTLLAEKGFGTEVMQPHFDIDNLFIVFGNRRKTKEHRAMHQTGLPRNTEPNADDRSRIRQSAENKSENCKPNNAAATTDFRMLKKYESSTYSQNGEDGIIARLFASIGVTNEYFVEFGVGKNAEECNTRLLRERGWTGLWMDICADNGQPDVRQERVTAENINTLFAKYDVPFDFDFLSIDIDGNDYWVRKAMDKQYRPRVIVMEYNAAIPPSQSKSIAYDPEFRWSNTDYFGASLAALERLNRRRGYTLVYCDSRGINAFFLRSDLVAPESKRPVEEIYCPPNYAQGKFFGLATLFWPRGVGHKRDNQRDMIDVE